MRAKVERDHQEHTAQGGPGASLQGPPGQGPGAGTMPPGKAGAGAPVSSVQYRRMVLGSSVLLGHVDRKLVKQTVMTSVYGVTTMGAKDQIHSRIRERGSAPPGAPARGGGG